MAKEDLITLDGQIDEILPDGRFGVMLENEHRIIAYTAGKMRKFRIRSIDPFALVSTWAGRAPRAPRTATR